MRPSHRAAAVHLPAEVWQQIASQMTLQEWAQACGSCKAMSQIQLQTVNLSRPRKGQRQIPPAGLLWVAQRCREAQVISIDGAGTSGKSGDIITALMQATAHNPALREFTLLANGDQLDVTKFEGGNEWAHAIAVQLARTAPLVHTFRCLARDLHTFPAMANLKHIVLRLPRAALEAGVSGVAALRNLKTLCLTGDSGTREFCGDDLDGQLLVDCPPLDFGSLSQLRHLSLEGITPEGINICSGCDLHLEVVGHHTAKHPVWEMLRDQGGSLRSLDWDRFDSFIYTVEDVPCVFRAHDNFQLDYVSIRVCDWTVRKLPAQLARVRFLHLNVDTFELDIPASTKWEAVCIHACYFLHMSFEDVGAFARSAPKFSFEAEDGLVNETVDALLALDAALGQSNSEWVSISSDLISESGMRHVCNVCPPGSIVEVENSVIPGTKRKAFTTHFELFPCLCKACHCTYCLAQRE